MAKIKNLETDQYVFFLSGPFSQWHPCEFKDTMGREFNSAEQYMMFYKAMLFGDYEIADKIMQAQTPKEQKELGRKVAGFDAEIWSQHARDIVYQGNRLKFTQNPGLWYLLARTGDKPLVEAADYDKIWGIGLAADNPRCADPAQWQGNNWLGETLTKLRGDLRRQGLPVPAAHQVSAREREYAYAYLALKVPRSPYFTTLKAIADHAQATIDQVIEGLKSVHPRDGDFDMIEAPVNNNGAMETMTVNSFLAANSETLAYAEIIRESIPFPENLKTPRLGL